jgi:hypothetical protein
MTYYEKNKEIMKKRSNERYNKMKQSPDWKNEKNQQTKDYRKKSKGRIEFWFSKMYFAIRTRNRKKFNLELPFSKDEFIIWINDKYKDILKELFDIYVESNFDKYKAPSIDRIDDYKSYTFDNMQLLSWEENDIKGNNCLKNKKSCSEVAKKYLSKGVEQLDLKDNVINTYCSVREAERQTGFCSSAIAKCCRGKGLTSKGYKWRYINE